MKLVHDYTWMRYYGEYYLRNVLKKWPEDANKKIFNPLVLQLPITYKCNFDCVMCGMHKMINRDDFTPEELKIILTDPLFKDIKSVGINGGEPFLKKNLVEYIDVIVDNLPNLQQIYMISNGYFTKQILTELKKIKEITKTKNIELSLSLSLDGIGDMQDFMRGKKGAFEHITETVNTLLKDKSQYVDRLDFICTITKYNVFSLCEVEQWSKEKEIGVAYNIATIHNRIYNYEKYNDFSVLEDPVAKKMAEEFFYSKFRENYSQKYYCIYKYLQTGERYAPCSYQGTAGVTVTPDGQLSYCATFSKELGNAVNESAEKLFKENVAYQKELVNEKCEHCSHYSYSVKKEKYKEYIQEILRCNAIFE